MAMATGNGTDELRNQVYEALRDIPLSCEARQKVAGRMMLIIIRHAAERNAAITSDLVTKEVKRQLQESGLLKEA